MTTKCENCGGLDGQHAFWCKVSTAKPVANEIQVAGTHYKNKTIQPWDYIASNGLGYFEGNVVKYVSRWRDKGGLQDLEKARHYLDKLIELNK